MHGTFEANIAMQGPTLMVCIGARFDDRCDGKLDAFSPDSRKIHIDIDRSLDQQDRGRLILGSSCELRPRVLGQMIRGVGDRKARTSVGEVEGARIAGVAPAAEMPCLSRRSDESIPA